MYNDKNKKKTTTSTIIIIFITLLFYLLRVTGLLKEIWGFHSQWNGVAHFLCGCSNLIIFWTALYTVFITL